MSLTLRQAIPQDAEAIAEVHVYAWQAAYADIVPGDFLAQLEVKKRAAWWYWHLSENQSLVMVALSGEKLVGWISFGVSRDDDAAGAGEICALYVLPAYWRQGVGSALMRAIVPQSRTFKSVSLWVLKQNKRACDFYLQIGFEPDGAEKIVAIGGAELTEIRYRRLPNQALLPTTTAVTPAASHPSRQP